MAFVSGRNDNDFLTLAKFEHIKDTRGMINTGRSTLRKPGRAT